MMRVREATHEDAAAWASKGLLGPCECDILEGIIVEDHSGNQLGFAGVYDAGVAIVAFSAYDPRVLKDRRVLVQAIRRMRLVFANYDQVLAFANLEERKTWLNYVGFEHVQDDIYVWRTHG